MFLVKFHKVIFCLMIGCTSLVQGQNNLPQVSQELAKNFTTKDTLFQAPYVDVDEFLLIVKRLR